MFQALWLLNGGSRLFAGSGKVFGDNLRSPAPLVERIEAGLARLPLPRSREVDDERSEPPACQDHIGGMRRIALFALLLLVLAGCGGAPTTACPDPDPDPNSPCATSHSHTYDGGRQ
jgi:hypothetical protein